VAQKPKLVVLSAPSGTGKYALLSRARELGADLVTTISATTRTPRPGEVDGREYYFLSRAAFEERRDAGEFVEWAEVHAHLYGTLLSEVERCLAGGGVVVLELDVQGMRHLKALRDDVVTVFLMPPSMEELERRLRTRGAKDEADVALRLHNAQGEITSSKAYDHVIVNDDLDRAARELIAILDARDDN